MADNENISFLVNDAICNRTKHFKQHGSHARAEIVVNKRAAQLNCPYSELTQVR